MWFIFLFGKILKMKINSFAVKRQKHMLNTCLLKPCKAVMKDGTAEKFSF